MAITAVEQRSDAVTVGCACTGGMSSLRCRWSWLQCSITCTTPYGDSTATRTWEWGREMNYTATIGDSPPLPSRSSSASMKKSPGIERPGRLSAVSGPQERVQRRTVQQIVDFAPSLPTLDDSAPQMVEQLRNILSFFRALSPDPGVVIEVPQILPEDVSMRTAVRVRNWRNSWENCHRSCLSLRLQGNPSSRSLTVQFRVVVFLVFKVFSQDRATFSQPSRSWTIQFLGRMVVEVFKVCTEDRIQTAFSEQIVEFPIQVEVFEIVSQSRVPQRFLQLLLDSLIKGFFAPFSTGKKVRRSRAPRGQNWVRSRAHGRHELSWGVVPLATTLTAARTSWGTTWGAESSPGAVAGAALCQPTEAFG